MVTSEAFSNLHDSVTHSEILSSSSEKNRAARRKRGCPGLSPLPKTKAGSGSRGTLSSRAPVASAFSLGTRGRRGLSQPPSNLLVAASLIKGLPDVVSHATAKRTQKPEIFQSHFRPSVPPSPGSVRNKHQRQRSLWRSGSRP